MKNERAGSVNKNVENCQAKNIKPPFEKPQNEKLVKYVVERALQNKKLWLDYSQITGVDVSNSTRKTRPRLDLNLIFYAKET